MAFKKYFLDHKLFWGFVSFFISILVVLKYVYGPWTQRAHYNGRVFLIMEPTLRWIVKAQERHKEVKGSYTEDMSSLIKEGFDIGDKSIAEDLAEQVKKYKRYPGMSYDKTHSGPTFYYEIRASDGDNYLAQATWMGFAHYGEAVWQIDKTGTLVNKVESQLMKDIQRFHWRDRVFSWWLLGSLVVMLWGMGEKVYGWINGRSKQKA